MGKLGKRNPRNASRRSSGVGSEASTEGLDMARSSRPAETQGRDRSGGVRTRAGMHASPLMYLLPTLPPHAGESVCRWAAAEECDGSARCFDCAGRVRQPGSHANHSGGPPPGRDPRSVHHASAMPKRRRLPRPASTRGRRTSRLCGGVRINAHRTVHQISKQPLRRRAK